MPQYPWYSFENPSNKPVPGAVDASNRVIIAPSSTITVTPTPIATSFTGNITSQTVVKASAGTLVGISVIVAGNATGTTNNVAQGNLSAVANQLTTIPNTVGVQTDLNIPCSTGISVTPGTGQTVAVWYA